MGLRDLIAVCTLLVLCSADQTFTMVNSMLDPNRITWWRSKWAPAPVVLSVNNRSRTSVSATFFFCPTTSMTKGVFEVTFPALFTVTGASVTYTGAAVTVNGQIVAVSAQTLTASADTQITISGLTNPNTAGAYGPFSLRTRYSNDGQQVDVNLNFGTVYITGDAGALGGLTVSLPTTSNVVNKSGNTLSFKFTIAVPLWKYDTFVINIDPNWIIASGATCSSYDYPGKVNNFNGTITGNPHSLQCIVSTRTVTTTTVGTTTTPTITPNTVYIYGLAVDGIDFSTTDNNSVDLRVTSVTNPDAAGSTYTWTVSTYRFGTYTNLETAQTTTGPTITYETIAQATFAPTWQMAASEVISTTTYFFDISFTTLNKLPKGSEIDIQITETFVGEANWIALVDQPCYIVLNLGKTVSCTVSTNNLQLKNLPDLASGTPIKLRALVNANNAASSSAKINYIKTYKGTIATAALVDVGSALGGFTISATGAVASFSFDYLDTSSTSTTSTWTAGGISKVSGSEYRNGLQFGVYSTALSAITTATTIEIKCPFATTMSDLQIGVPANVWGFKYTGTTSAAIDPTAWSAFTANAPTSSYTGTDTTPGSISYTGAVCTASPFTGCQGVAFHLQVYQAATGSAAISLPRVATNRATAYECRVAVTTTGQPPIRSAIRFKVDPQPWLTTGTTSSFILPCTTYVNGIPAIFTLSPQVIAIASGTSANYYIEFEFASSKLGSGLVMTTVDTPKGENVLDYAVDYPVSSSSTVTGKIYDYSSKGFVVVSGISIAITATPTLVSVYFPIGGFTVTGPTLIEPIVRSYYINSSDTRYKFISIESTFTGNSAVATTTAFAVKNSVANGSTATDSIINGSTHTSGLILSLQMTGTTANSLTNHYIYFVLPTGFTWSGTKSVKNNAIGTGGTNYSNAWYFTSPSAKFAFPGVLVYTKESSSILYLPNVAATPVLTTATITITGFTAPLGAQSSTYIKAVSGGGASNACLGVTTSDITFTTTKGAISLTSVSPTSIKTRGSDGVNISHSVAFTLPHGVPADGGIDVGFSTDWGTAGTCTSCTVSGLTPATTGGTVSCVIGTSTATITAFADFQATPGQPVTVQFNGLLAPMSASTGTAYFVSSIKSYTGTTYQGTSNDIDYFAGGATGNTAITVVLSTTAGSTTWTTKKTYPSSASATNVDLYLKFTLPHSLPKCGIITLASPLAFKLTGNLSNSCFLSPTAYSYCKINSNNLEIQLNQDYSAGSPLELYLDAAVDNASTTTASATGFTITAKWGDITVDADTGTVQTQQTIAATATLTSTITGSATSSLSFVPKTTGELATYTLDFKDSVNYTVGDQYWIVFPKEFDYFLGDVWTWFTNESNVYYIDCSSTQLGTAWCTVDHNIVVITGSNAITGSTQIVINIQGVVNPPAAQTSAFQIYHVNANGDFLTVSQNYGTVTPTAFASNLDVRSLDQSDRRIFKSSDYKWRLYIVDTMSTDSQLKVLFPREFDLSKFDKKDSYSCSSTWLDTSASATIKTQQSWNPASSCSASGNWVTLGSPTTSTPFTATNIVTWSVLSVMNVQWAQPRSATTLAHYDFDVTDSVLWPLDPFWAGKFTFFVYKSAATSLTYSSRSYHNMNAAYAGYLQGYRQILVNNYGPQMKSNRIVVRAGTQSTDLYISTSATTVPMAAKQIVFTPTTNSRTPDSGKLKYSSAVDNWTLFQSYWRIQFRVAAGIDMVKGLYYIDWSNNETKQSGLNDVQYDIPVSTLVEVIGKTAGQYTFAVSTIPNISTGYTSIPIKISITNSPHTDCTVNISVSGTPANISITPTALTFSPDVNEKYFQIQVASNYDMTLGTVQTLQFSLTGTDAYAFTIAASLKITITQASTSIVPGNVVSWGLGQATKISQSVTPSVDQTGVIYYSLAAAGTTVPSYSSLKSSVKSLVGTNTTNSNPGAGEGANTQSDPQTGETWIDFQRRLYKTHLQATWTGSISMYATTAVKTITFSWLWAGTSYQISGYLDNLSSSTTDPAVRTEVFTTTAIADCQPFAVKFQGSVASSFQTKISQEAAGVMGVNPLRLVSPTYGTSTSRVLQTPPTTTDTVAFSTFTYTLLPNRFSENPAPADQAKITGTALATFTAALKAGGITNTLNSVANGAVPSRVTPQWTASPSSGGATTNSVTVSLRANVAGQTCCVALTGTTSPPTPEQVMLGLASTNTASSSLCITTDLTQTSNSVQVSSLQSSTAYYVYCTATDNYPMWPTQMAYSTTNTMTPVSITTLGGGNTVVTGASYFGGIFLLLAFLLH